MWSNTGLKLFILVSACYMASRTKEKAGFRYSPEAAFSFNPAGLKAIRFAVKWMGSSAVCNAFMLFELFAEFGDIISNNNYLRPGVAVYLPSSGITVT